jgi:hypothetical protein
MRKQKINTCSLCSERLQKRKGEEKNQTKLKANNQSQMNIFEDTFSIFSQLFTHFDMTERTITDNINQIAGPGAIQLPVKAAKD